MVIRKARLEDINCLIELRKKQLIDEGTEERNIDSQLNDYFVLELGKSFVCFVAVEEDIIATAGVCFYHIPPNFTNPTGMIAYVTNLYTKPEYRGNGIATKLLNEINKEIEKRGCHVIRLHASSYGRRIYEKAGFTDLEGFMVKKI